MGLTTSAYSGGRTVSLESYKDKLHSGDIALFSGDGWESSIVQVGTLSPWSHVGMVVRTRQFRGKKGADPDDLYLWHSLDQRVRRCPDMLDKPKKLRDGPQLISLTGAFHAYKGSCFIRNLSPRALEIFTESARKQEETFAFMRSAVKTHYEICFNELFYAAYDGPGGENPPEDRASYFCSELVACTYQVMGLLPTGTRAKKANEYTPVDFSSAQSVPFFDSDVYLSQEVQIV